MPADQPRIVAAVETLLDPAPRRLGHRLRTRQDGGKIDRDGADPDAEIAGAAREMRDPRGGDRRLRRRAAEVDAGTADLRPLDQRHKLVPAGEAPGERNARLAGADDDDIVVR